MGSEIERTFMVDERELLTSGYPNGSLLHQGYLSDDPVVRIRFCPEPPNDEKNWGMLAIKGPGLIERAEFQYPVYNARELYELARWRLQKTRYDVPWGEHSWEIDQFHGYLEGLWLAEIELPHRKAQFELPDWLGPEVTFDAAFANIALAKRMSLPDRWREWVRVR